MKKFVLTFLLLVSYISKGQNLYIDTSFGNSGKVITTSSLYPVNVFFENNKYYFVYLRNGMVSLNYDGSFNQEFGTNGQFFFNNSNEDLNVKGTKLINGYFYIFGEIVYTSSSSNKDLFIAKVSMSGVLDTSFGQNGVVRQDFSSSDVLNDFLPTSDGKFMGVGSKVQTNSSFFISKYNSNGTIDTSFDSNGYKTYPINANEKSYGANILNFENNLLVFGRLKINNDVNNLFFLKIDENGNIITTFGVNGVKQVLIATTFSTGYQVYGAHLSTNNDIFYGCYSNYSSSSLYNDIKKVNLNTNTITTFSSLPYNRPYFEFDEVQNSVYITGTEGSSNNNFLLFKRNQNGTLDTTFNSTGSFNYSFFPGDVISNDASSVFYRHNDGKILIGGYTYNLPSASTGLAFVRLTDVQLSLSNNNIHTPSIVPNPIKEELTIENFDDKLITEIKIYDLLGNQVFISTENGKKINLSSLQQGIYLAKIKADDIDYFVKFIKS